MEFDFEIGAGRNNIFEKDCFQSQVGKRFDTQKGRVELVRAKVHEDGKYATLRFRHIREEMDSGPACMECKHHHSNFLIGGNCFFCIMFGGPCQ